MRLINYLDELFTPSNISVIKNEKDKFSTSFFVGDYKFVFNAFTNKQNYKTLDGFLGRFRFIKLNQQVYNKYFDRYRNELVWEVKFSNMDGTNIDKHMFGSGEMYNDPGSVTKVFGSVIHSINQFIKVKDPNVIMFHSQWDKRNKLYNKLINKFNDKYEILGVNPQNNLYIWLFVKK